MFVVLNMFFKKVCAGRRLHRQFLALTVATLCLALFLLRSIKIPNAYHSLFFLPGDEDIVYSQVVYVMSAIPSGGALKYLLDLQRAFPDVQFVRLDSKEKLLTAPIRSHKDILFVNHLLFTGVSCGDILNITEKLPALKVVLQIHDWYFLVLVNRFSDKVHQVYINVSENQPDPDCKQLFARSALVIYPSQFILSTMNASLGSPGAVVVHPNDYTVERTSVTYMKVTDSINLGVLSKLTVYKGKELVKILSKTYPTFKGYKVFIKVVRVDIPQYDDDIESFFALIRRENIHGLLYLSRWGETYSYAMTKYLISGLPILYNNFGAFRERLVNMPGTFPMFQNEEEYVAALRDYKGKKEINSTSGLALAYQSFEAFLDLLVVKGSASKYSFPKPMFQVKPFYKKSFLPYAHKENLVIVTSKLLVSARPFKYTKKRSMYSFDERFAQTKETIASIRKYIPRAYIVMFDDSVSLPYDCRAYLENATDVFVNVHSAALSELTDHSLYKAFGELAQLIQLYDSFLQRIDFSSFKNVFKITGRYTVTAAFNIDDYSRVLTHNLTFKRNTALPKLQYYFTCFYRIAPSYVHDYFRLLRSILLSRNEFISSKLLNLEEILPRSLDYSFQSIEKLGIRQNVAVWNETSEI
jgi:hypothetical protein